METKLLNIIQDLSIHIKYLCYTFTVWDLLILIGLIIGLIYLRSLVKSNNSIDNRLRMLGNKLYEISDLDRFTSDEITCEEQPPNPDGSVDLIFNIPDKDIKKLVSYAITDILTKAVMKEQSQEEDSIPKEPIPPESRNIRDEQM